MFDDDDEEDDEDEDDDDDGDNNNDADAGGDDDDAGGDDDDHHHDDMIWVTARKIELPMKGTSAWQIHPMWVKLTIRWSPYLPPFF